MKLAKDLAFYLGVEREDEVVETIPTPQVSEKLVELPQTEEHPKPMPETSPPRRSPSIKLLKRLRTM